METADILNAELITKNTILKKLISSKLDQVEIDEYLDMLCYLKAGYSIYKIETKDGFYLLFIDKKNLTSNQ